MAVAVLTRHAPTPGLSQIHATATPTTFRQPTRRLTVYRSIIVLQQTEAAALTQHAPTLDLKLIPANATPTTTVLLILKAIAFLSIIAKLIMVDAERTRFVP